MFLFLPKIEMANWHTTSVTVVAGGELGYVVNGQTTLSWYLPSAMVGN